MGKRPFVFIGSSAEGLKIAKAIQSNLEYVCETQLWSQGLFGLTEGTLEVLVESLPKFDFAILALTGDDVTISRGAEQKSPRDNVLFELGLFIGGLGTQRVFIVIDRKSKPKLPSDLAGITPGTYEPPTSGNFQSALGAACNAIEAKIEAIGPLTRAPTSVTDQIVPTSASSEASPYAPQFVRWSFVVLGTMTAVRRFGSAFSSAGDTWAELRLGRQRYNMQLLSSRGIKGTEISATAMKVGLEIDGPIASRLVVNNDSI